MRVHPLDQPVVLPNKYLRYASDQQLADHYARAQGNTAAQEAARHQVLHEMQRRDQAQERREATEERRRIRYTARRTARGEAIETAWLAAQADTRGNMLDRRGREAGINERTLFTGPESRARKYASEELLNHWENHPRPTETFFSGPRYADRLRPGLWRATAYDH
jgi:hypothetical protein